MAISQDLGINPEERHPAPASESLAGRCMQLRITRASPLRSRVQLKRLQRFEFN